MTRSVVDPLPHDIAVTSALATLGRAVGYAEAPVGALTALRAAPSDATKAYFVVWPVPGGDRDGSMDDPFADVELVYTLWVVGGRPTHVRTLTGAIEAALVNVSITGRRVLSVELVLGGVTKDESTTPAIFTATPQARISTTPA